MSDDDRIAHPINLRSANEFSDNFGGFEHVCQRTALV